MKFSVIIPTWRDDKSLTNCLNSLYRQNYPKKEFEIILASKKKLKILNSNVTVVKIGSLVNHAQARNFAAAKAKGEILAFCDDDSILPQNWLRTADSYFLQNKGDLIGGPVIAPKNSPFKYRLSGYLAGSRFTMGFAAYKFTAFNEREAINSDLILANNFIRKNIFDQVGGFDKDQVPCEENLLYEKVRKNGYKLLYVPKLACVHPSKPIFLPLARKVYFYATGRGLLIIRAPQTFHLQYLIPSLFVLSLIFLPIISLFFQATLWFLFVILLVYFFLTLVNSLLIFIRLERNFFILLIAPIVTFIVQISYGLGVLNGFLRYLLNKRNSVKMPSNKY